MIVNTGSILIFVAFGAGGAALVAWLLGGAANAAARRRARGFFYAMTAALLLASVLLFSAIFSDDFSLRYVSEYSSRGLPVLYKVAAFWGGQEGTLLLWTLLQGLVGIALLRRRDDWEPAVMSFLMVPQALLLFVLVKVRPFEEIPPPPDGAGLNPLLLDPWMAIHPPIVFIGYAALAAPFAFALAALARREADAWVPRVLPWVLISILTLGLGLFIGGFWAYKVLGWGGYWGWDPVENSSLAPWVVAAALLHGLLTQKATRHLKRTNLALAALAYVLVLFATYMTRSGVLADFSVHSFADGGIHAHLLAAMGVCALLPAVLLARRWSSLRGPELDWKLGLPAMMALAMILLLAGTALLVVGTSWPILSSLAGEPASPGPGFYNRTSLPVGAALAALLVAAPLMSWVPTTWRQLLAKTAPGLAAGILAAALPLALGWWPKGGALVLVLLGAAAGALVASAARVARQLRRAPLAAGAGLSHAGLALMFIGIVTTSAFDRTETVALAAGEPREALGRKLTLVDYAARPADREPHFRIDVEPASGDPFVAEPIMFRDEKRGMTIARPHIQRSALADLYIAPVSHRPAEGPEKRLALAKGEAQTFGPLALTFVKFQSHAEAAGALSVGALVDVAKDGRTEPVTLVLTMGPGGVTSPWVDLPMGGGAAGRLDGMLVEAGTIKVTLKDPAGAASPETLTADVSTKPLVNALWAGILLVALGSALATAHRLREERAILAAPAFLDPRGAIRVPAALARARGASPPARAPRASAP
jgi:cytochrome c-type biogenesis protein CcmF